MSCGRMLDRYAGIEKSIGLAFDRAMLKGALALAVAGHGLALAKEFVLVNREAFEAHGPAGVQFSGADPDLRAQAVTETVGESRGGVLKNIGRVDELHEARSDIMALRHDGFGMPRTVPVDVFDGFVDSIHYFDGNDEVGILLLPILYRGGSDGLSQRQFLSPGAAANFHSGFVEFSDHTRQENRRDVFMALHTAGY